MVEDSKWIYAFGNGTAEGEATQAALLGGKGAGLAQMSRLGIPVPPGFTLTTEAVQSVQPRGRPLSGGPRGRVPVAARGLEGLLGSGFGRPENPLLLSVRSGAPISMPGMMDTILNLGLNEEIVTAQIDAGWDARFLYDCYRR